MGTPVLRVLIIAGDPLARSGLAHILADQSGLCVVGQATMHADLSAEIGATRPRREASLAPLSSH
jgi:DNA-binding NarL/FixJ family response regulator